MSFFFLFFLLYFWYWSVLLCWAGRVGRDGLEEWKGWMGLEGEVVSYWQKGGFFVAIWRKRERSNSKQIKQTRKHIAIDRPD